MTPAMSRSGSASYNGAAAKDNATQYSILQTATPLSELMTHAEDEHLLASRAIEAI
jgi:hypothetical protein